MSNGRSTRHSSYDVVIVGGAMLGSSVAWFLADNPDFDGRILVVERDPTYALCSTAHTNSCMRQQFSNEINIRISQFAAEYVKNFRDHMGGDMRIPRVVMQNFGYMYLAGSVEAAENLRASQRLQASLGAGTRFMSPGEIAAAYPFYRLDDIIGGNHNLVDEGYFDGNTLFDWWRRRAREAGVEFLKGEVVAMTLVPGGSRVASLRLASGEEVQCGWLVNASGPRAARVARMAGIELPVEPRKRYTFVFAAEKPLAGELPLTVDPSGVHVRSDGACYMAGCPPVDDRAVDYDDFVEDHTLWQEKAWPAIAWRIPAFEAVKLVNSWVGHYAYNVLDQNAIVGPHDEVENFLFVNGFSGHGLQQSPAMGRGIAEWISYGGYRSLDLAPLGFGRVRAGRPLPEQAVI
ncbi:MAG: FAD-binding oxidoreductase [Rhodobacteraceae bacterium]|nr:FAD-binding oxidoreductase [Paracoccaceae bacterium]